MKPLVIFFCTSIALLNGPYMYGLNLKFNLKSNIFSIISGVLASLFLILTGLTIAEGSPIHTIFCLMFCMFFILYEIFVSFSASKTNPSLKIIGLSIVGCNLLLTLILFILYGLTGITEITFLGLNCIWLIIFATRIVF